MSEPTLLAHFPELESRLSFASLGEFPTPVVPFGTLVPALTGKEAYIKREDESAGIYGGNKVRTLEVLFGEARRRGAARIYAVGAFGSNHALATVLHAPRVGLESGAVLFPQPPSATARDNLEHVATLADDLVVLPHWSALPFQTHRLKRRSDVPCMVMAPGGAEPLGALGYVSAALELAEQISAGVIPEPRRVVVGVGSTCTSAGLLVGFRVARALGLAFARGVPRLISVRVSPWPVTSPLRITHLAYRTSALLARWLRHGEYFRFGFSELRSGLHLETRYLGLGYGRVTDEGRTAIDALGEFGNLALDTTYSAKSAAAYLRWLEEPGPSLYWATKSSRPLPPIPAGALDHAPTAVKQWLAKCPVSRHS